MYKSLINALYLPCLSHPQQEQHEPSLLAITQCHLFPWWTWTMMSSETCTQGRRRRSNECLHWPSGKTRYSFHHHVCARVRKMVKQLDNWSESRPPENPLMINDFFLAFMVTRKSVAIGGLRTSDQSEKGWKIEFSSFFTTLSAAAPRQTASPFFLCSSTLKFHTLNPFNQIALNRSINFL